VDRDRFIDVLGRTSLFGGLPPELLESLAAACVQRVYPRDQYLWYQGDPGDRLVVVAAGLVKVVVHSEAGDQIVLAALGPPEVLGELALIDEGPRSASVIAAAETTVLMIQRSVLLRLMRQDTALLEAMLRSIGALLRRLTEQTADLVFLDLGGRMAKLLLRLADEHGRRVDGSTVLHLRLNQTDLAQMVGASRPAVNRILQSFAGRGFVTLDGHAIVIHDSTALARRAGMA
jgi:CRP/FNR family cyclic AMP-dependent transcriptional regulator